MTGAITNTRDSSRRVQPLGRGAVLGRLLFSLFGGSCCIIFDAVRSRLCFRVFIFISCFLFLFPNTCQALQSHGAPEGLYVHQLAHLHFIVALIYLYWDIKRNAFISPGWRCVRMFCLLMFCWNIIAFTGHVAGGFIGSDQIFRGEGYLHSKVVGPVTAVTFTYYLTKFDHIVAVPALFFLYFGMRTMRRSVETGDRGGER